MRRHTDPYINCPFDRQHTMPEPRLQWHLNKCKARAKHIEEGKPVYHCKFFQLHIFFTENGLARHESLCDKKPRGEAEDETILVATPYGDTEL